MTETRASENNAARDAILVSIRGSLAVSKPFDAEHQKHHAHGVILQGKVHRELSTKELVDNFKTNLESVGGICVIVANEGEAAIYVETVIEKIAAKNVAISDSDLVYRLTETLDGIDVIQNATKDILFDCDLGITSAQWAIAETGTLVLESEAESHRLTSLVPPVHLCILKADVIRQTLSEILELTSKNLSKTITFITGASRTSDIELTLAIGVHGPRELHVVVVADQ
ncbi:MAG TPA: LUD domain-containing protein [Pyrinomonadaceae bacterium]|nr:LUD domain-containing protein [Pyrinomonadaceae bacterium]